MAPWKRHKPLSSSEIPADVRKPKKKWSLLGILWIALVRTCTVIGAFVLITVALAFFSLSQVGQAVEKPLPKDMVLYLEFRDGFTEMPSGSALAASLGLEPPTVHELVDSIDMAAKDDRVKGIMARLDGGTFAPAQTQEVREALKRFRAAGKFTKIYSPSYGESTGGLGRFYLASAFEDRWMQPLGVVSIPGIAAEMPFFKGTLDKLGVKPEFFKRKDYKTAYENLTDAQMSPQNREMIVGIVNDLRLALVGDISADLAMTPLAFEQLVNRGLFTSREALQAKLITRSDYVDVLIGDITEQITGDRESDAEIFIDPKSYLAGVGRERMITDKVSAAAPVIAVVHVNGVIMDSRIGVKVGIAGEGNAAADEIAPALMDAADDPNIHAVVMRIDSPGGSPVASETILRAVEKVREKGKPVVISMGNTAASGGYWVAAYGDRIFAEPTTVTGSIGVVGGKFSARELAEKYGVTFDGVKWGDNSELWSMTKTFSESEAERMNAMLDQVYDAFLERVAKGRKMTTAQVDAIAGGRVWSGIKAKEIGLVDELGGLQNAMDYTATLLQAENRFGVTTILLPKPLTAFEEVMQLLGEQGAVLEGFRFNAAISHLLSPALDQWSVMSNPDLTIYEPLTVR